MVNKTLIALAVSATFALTGCQTISYESNTTTDAPVTKVIEAPAKSSGTKITLKQAMAHPDWLGRQPLSSYWAADSSSIFYTRKQDGNELKSLFNQNLTANNNGEKVAIEDFIKQAQNMQLILMIENFKPMYLKGMCLLKM